MKREVLAIESRTAQNEDQGYNFTPESYERKRKRAENMQSHRMSIILDVLLESGNDTIFGKSWLKTHNLSINWKTRVLRFDRDSYETASGFKKPCYGLRNEKDKGEDNTFTSTQVDFYKKVDSTDSIKGKNDRKSQRMIFTTISENPHKLQKRANRFNTSQQTTISRLPSGLNTLILILNLFENRQN